MRGDVPHQSHNAALNPWSSAGIAPEIPRPGTMKMWWRRFKTKEFKHLISIRVAISNYWTACSPPYASWLACELRAKPMPPVPYEFIANIHTAFMQEVFYISQWKWKPHIQHNCELDDLRTGFEIAGRNFIGHSLIANCRGSSQQGGLFWKGLYGA